MHRNFYNKRHIDYNPFEYNSWGEDMSFKQAGLFLVSGVFAQSVQAADLPHWSYDGMNDGQDMWGQLSPAYIKCEGGTAQSPIIISYTKAADLKPLTFKYEDTADALLARDEYGITISFNGKSVLNADGKDYVLKSIELHSPSEHTIQEKYFMMEIQLLHENKDGSKLNIAILVESGDENQAVHQITSSFPVSLGSSKKIKISPALLLPASLGYYAYSGSITRPPCTEGVEWRVLKKPLGISYQQANDIITLLGRNARLEQPVYSRTILETQY